MEKIINSPDIKVTDPLKNQIFESLDKLSHFNDNITLSQVSLRKDNHETNNFIAKIDVYVAGKPHIHAETHHIDMYEAIKSSTNKLVGQLRKLKTKQKVQRHKQKVAV